MESKLDLYSWRCRNEQIKGFDRCMKYFYLVESFAFFDFEWHAMMKRLINSQTSPVRYQFVFMNVTSTYFPFSTNFPRKIQFSSWGFFNFHYYFFQMKIYQKKWNFTTVFCYFVFVINFQPRMIYLVMILLFCSILYVSVLKMSHWNWRAKEFQY